MKSSKNVLQSQIVKEAVNANAKSNANCMLHIHLQCGEIKDVRIAHKQLGRSKGFAYLEFTDQVSGTLTA